ncbi:50S ribosomal protein L10 [Patescibacteria group bacterium]|nr:50S ribosomal protein L10 [Patescibacteria group bacterium]
MPKTRQQKLVAKDRLVEEFKNAKSVIFADYKGMTVEQVSELRKKTREANINYVVAKKSLFTLAAKEAGVVLNAKQFPGMLGAAFGLEDEVAPAKVLGDAAKKTSMKLVGGLFEGVMVDQEKAVALSKLPSKKELLGMVVGTMYAPVSAFVRALNAIRESRESGSPVAAAPVVAEEVAPEAPVVEVAPVAEEVVPEVAPVVEAAPAESAPAPEETPAA